MNRKYLILILGIFAVFLFFLLYLLFFDNSQINDSVNDIKVDEDYKAPISGKVIQNTTLVPIIKDPRENMSFLYWGSNQIPYHFSEEYPCLDERRSRIFYAFKIINQDTMRNVSFYEENSSSGIEINCFENLVGAEKQGKNSATAGEATITEAFNHKIVSAEINLYKINPDYEYCKGYPTTEVHELLHVFGIDHIIGRASILNEKRGHGQECTYLDEEIISCLRYIYGDLNNDYSCKGIPFYELEDVGCSDGWYPVINTSSCCPEPDMRIEDDYCVY